LKIYIDNCAIKINKIIIISIIIIIIITKESVYLLLEIRSRQLADLVQLLQYFHELLSLCIGLWIQWRFCS